MDLIYEQGTPSDPSEWLPQYCGIGVLVRLLVQKPKCFGRRMLQQLRLQVGFDFFMHGHRDAGANSCIGFVGYAVVGVFSNNSSSGNGLFNKSLDYLPATSLNFSWLIHS